MSFLLGFFTPKLGFRILGALVGSTLFVDSFVAKVLHEGLRLYLVSLCL
jgi:hypothetical protein